MKKTMIKNRLRELLEKDKPTIGTHMIGTWPLVVEEIGAIGKYDYVEFSSEYSPWEWIIRLEDMVRAAELVGLSTMVKIDPTPKTYLIQRSLATGVQSVLVTDCHDAEEVEEAIKAVKPEPEGVGSLRMSRRFSLALREQPDFRKAMEDYVRSLDEVVICLMIEKKGAVENLEDILSIEGVDMIQWGPADYSVTKRTGYNVPFRDEESWKTELKVIKTALEMDIRPRIECGVKDMQKYIDLGARDFCIGTDTVYKQKWAEEGSEIRKILEKNKLT